MSFWIWMIIGLLPLVLLVVLYNKLIRHRNLVREAWSGIDVQLKLRHNLVPNLVEMVQGYVGHERNLLEDITRLRAQGEKAKEQGETEEAEGHLTGALKNVLALVENYPDLKASENFLKLQDQLVDIEDRIQMARRYYNGSVRDFNTVIESFPSNLVASMFHFEVCQFFELETATERLVPSVKFETQETS